MPEETDPTSDEEIKKGRAILEKLDQAGTPYPASPAKIVKRLSRYAGDYPVRNLAVDLCEQAFAESTKQALKEGKSTQTAKEQGSVAFCGSLPKLEGASNIRDFIACVTHGMALGIIPSTEGTRLLYAAQVAHIVRTKKAQKTQQIVPNKHRNNDKGAS
jgi:hypothetical protein